MSKFAKSQNGEEKKRERKHWQKIKAMELNSFFSFFPCSMFCLEMLDLECNLMSKKIANPNRLGPKLVPSHDKISSWFGYRGSSIL